MQVRARRAQICDRDVCFEHGLREGKPIMPTPPPDQQQVGCPDGRRDGFSAIGVTRSTSGCRLMTGNGRNRAVWNPATQWLANPPVDGDQKLCLAQDFRRR